MGEKGKLITEAYQEENTFQEETTAADLEDWSHSSDSDSWTETPVVGSYYDYDSDYFSGDNGHILDDDVESTQSNKSEIAELEFVQTTSLILIAVVGGLILGIFCFSLWVGRRTVRDMKIPSRMRDVWANVRVIPFRPVVAFRRSATLGNAGLMTSQPRPRFESGAYTESSPIFNHIPQMEEDDSDMSSDDESTGLKQRSRKSRQATGADDRARYMGEGLGSFPHQPYPDQDRPDRNNCEEFIYYKVITI